MKIKMNQDEVKEQIAKVVKEAGEWGNQGGEIQLYARIDPETGFAEKFFTETFADHNSWVEGEDIINVYTANWFNPLDIVDRREWFETELSNDSKLFKLFQEKYKQEFKEELLDERQASWEYDEFRQFFPKKWESFLREWEQQELEDIVNNIDYKMIFDRLEELEGVSLSNEYPRTEQVQEMSAEEVLELTKADHQKTNRHNLNLGERDR